MPTVSDQFVHLHVHTEYSMLDGAAKVSPLIAEAQRLSMPAVAMTDHGNMYGSAEFYRTATAAGITPILGIEAYVAPASRHHKKPIFWGQANQRGSDEFGEGGDVSGSGAYTHMTMLAANATGLRNLFTLSSLASFEGHYRKPRCDRELVSQYHEGIIATTGCPSGEVQTRLRLGQRKEASQAASDYRDIFGAENFFLELMDHGLPIERSVREGLLEIGRTLGLKPLATNDSHYVTQNQAEAHSALLCVQAGKTLDDPTRFKFDGDGYYLKSAAEMRTYWDAEVPGAADNTLVIAQRVESYDDVFAQVDRKPRVPLKPEENEDTVLGAAVHCGAQHRFPGGLPPGYQQRLDTELGIIAGQRYASYFLVVDDLMRWASSQRVFCRCRGSAAGSLVLFMLRITDLDPMVHGLFFERFLNPDRVSPPDIDIDVEDRHRGAVTEYLSDRWGSENIAQVITFGTIKTKSAIKDATRVLGHPYTVGERLTKALPSAIHGKDVPLTAITDMAHERYGECATIRGMLEGDDRAAQIVTTAAGLEGLIRSAGVHACGVFLSSEPLIGVLPLWKRPDDDAIITGWDWSSCEDVGLLKLDVLGSDTLSVITDTVAAVHRNHNVTIDLDALPLDDPTTYSLLASGETLGVFQMEGSGARALLREIRPTCFADICAATALYRPGPMGMGTHHEYAARKNGTSPVTPIHPELAEPLAKVLSGTFGLCTYQEDVMAIAREVAGYTLGQADLLRRAMGKKKPEILIGEHTRFSAGMTANGYSAEATEALWGTMLPFSEYGFVRSHAASYGLVSYWTAWLKAHYPTEFMAARLTSVSDNKTRCAIYLAECRRMGIKVLPPDVNDSGLYFAAAGSDIRFGLGAIRNVGANVVGSIIATREKKGRYTSFADFLEKVELVCCNKRTIESLIKAGAFDSFGHTRCSLVGVHEEAVAAVTGAKRQDQAGQRDLFTDVPGASPLAHLVLRPEEWTQRDLLGHERDMLGLCVSAHPLDGAETVLRACARRSLAELIADAPDSGDVTIAGMITAVDRRVDKKGAPWAIITLEDLSASVEVPFFSTAYSALGDLLTPDAIVAISGRVSWRNDTLSVVGMSVVTLDIEAPLDQGVVWIRVDPVGVTNDAVARLRSVLVSHRGTAPLRLILGEYLKLVVDDYPVMDSHSLRVAVHGINGMSVL